MGILQHQDCANAECCHSARGLGEGRGDRCHDNLAARLGQGAQAGEWVRRSPSIVPAGLSGEMFRSLIAMEIGSFSSFCSRSE